MELPPVPKYRVHFTIWFTEHKQLHTVWMAGLSVWLRLRKITTLRAALLRRFRHFLIMLRVFVKWWHLSGVMHVINVCMDYAHICLAAGIKPTPFASQPATPTLVVFSLLLRYRIATNVVRRRIIFLQKTAVTWRRILKNQGFIRV